MAKQSQTFDELIAEFNELVETGPSLKGNDRTRNRRRRQRVISEVAKLADSVANGSYNEEFASCRDLGHSWDVTFDDFETQVEYLRLAVCARCGTQRTEMFIFPSGALAYRKYTHPEGYAISEIPEDSEISRIGTRSKRFWRAVSMQRSRVKSDD